MKGFLMFILAIVFGVGFICAGVVTFAAVSFAVVGLPDPLSGEVYQLDRFGVGGVAYRLVSGVVMIIVGRGFIVIGVLARRVRRERLIIAITLLGGGLITVVLALALPASNASASWWTGAFMIFLGVGAFMEWWRMRVAGEAPSQAPAPEPYYQDERGRFICIHCDKIIYTEYAARNASINAMERSGTYLRDYYEPRCGNYHLTSQPPRY